MSADRERVAPGVEWDSGDSASERDRATRSSGRDPRGSTRQTAAPERVRAAIDALERIDWSGTPGVAAVTAAVFVDHLATAERKLREGSE